jgi:hypothetical protein
VQRLFDSEPSQNRLPNGLQSNHFVELRTGTGHCGDPAAKEKAAN